MSQLEAAIHHAILAHAGQIDEDGTPHIVHCMKVMLAVKHEYESKQCLVAQFYTLEELMIAAILHDAVEDSKDNPDAILVFTSEMIERHYGLKIAAVVTGVTRHEFDECVNCGQAKRASAHDPILDSAHHKFRPKKESYRDFIYRVKRNYGSRFIKIADLLHNMSRTHLISEKKAKWRDKLQYKYRIAERVLNAEHVTSWECESWEFLGGKHYIADPNGKRIHITAEEAQAIRAIQKRSV